MGCDLPLSFITDWSSNVAKVISQEMITTLMIQAEAYWKRINEERDDIIGEMEAALAEGEDGATLVVEVPVSSGYNPAETFYEPYDS